MLSINHAVEIKRPIINNSKNEVTEGLTSGYSSHSNSLQASEENLTKLDFNDVKNEVLQIQSQEDNAANSNEYIPIIPPNELEPHKEWYNNLLMMREQYKKKERGSFPPFPPPPLPSSMIAASRASHINPFDDIKLSNVKDVDQLMKNRQNQLYTHRFMPSDFRPLPPPHVFLEMIKTLAPHQYVDLTYALAGAALLELGLRIPEHFPPLPPKMEPMSKVLEEQITVESDVMSSESSSDGEYSDDSESVKNMKRQKREENFKRREARRSRILKSKFRDNFEERKDQQKEFDITAEEKQNALDREFNYKNRTLKAFIPPRNVNRPIYHVPPSVSYLPPLILPITPIGIMPPFDFHLPIYPPMFDQLPVPYPPCVFKPPVVPSSVSSSSNCSNTRTSSDCERSPTKEDKSPAKSEVGNREKTEKPVKKILLAFNNNKHHSSKELENLKKCDTLENRRRFTRHRPSRQRRNNNLQKV